MLIHLGGQEFIDMQSCVAIVNLQTIDTATKKRVQASLPPHKEEPRTAILTISGSWLSSTISPEALAQRGQATPYPGALYLRLSAGKNPDIE